jgi:RNA polymerase sigma-70 factor (ECF subfamily)
MRNIFHTELQEKEETTSDSIIAESRTIINGALNVLSSIERDVIFLRIIKGYSLRDAARILEKPEEKIKSLQFKALKKVNINLRKSGYFSSKEDS